MATEAAEPLDERVHIHQEHGFLCHITVQTCLRVPPRQAFEIISDPDNARIFRSIEECTYRKILLENRAKKRVSIEHQSGWKFLWHKGQFATKLLVEQDDDAMVMAFRLAEQGFMKNFEGFWRMEPMPGDPEATLAVLHQNVLPVVYAPGLNWVFTKICKAQIEAMLQDVRAEVDRLKSGAPIPKEQQEKMKGKRSWVTKPVTGFSLDFDSESDDGSAAAGPIGDTAAPEPSRDSMGNVTNIEQQQQQQQQQAIVGSSDHWPLLDAAKHNMISVSGDSAQDESAQED